MKTQKTTLHNNHPKNHKVKIYTVIANILLANKQKARKVSKIKTTIPYSTYKISTKIMKMKINNNQNQAKFIFETTLNERLNQTHSYLKPSFCGSRANKLHAL